MQGTKHNFPLISPLREDKYHKNFVAVNTQSFSKVINKVERLLLFFHSDSVTCYCENLVLQNKKTLFNISIKSLRHISMVLGFAGLHTQLAP